MLNWELDLPTELGMANAIPSSTEINNKKCYKTVFEAKIENFISSPVILFPI